MELRTDEKLEFSPLSPADLDVLFALTSDPAVAEFMRFDVHQTRGEAAALLSEYTEPGNLAWLLRLAREGGPAGVAALKRDEKWPGGASLSLFFFPRLWGRGLAAAALPELRRRAAECGFRRLSAYIVGENTASRRAAERFGFQLEEVLALEGLSSGLYIYGYDL